MKIKKNHNFSDTPSSKCVVCNRTENLEHFLLHCSRFATARVTLFNVARTLNVVFENMQDKDKTKLLLYGDIAFSLATNKSLLEATLSFLRETNRFSKPNN